MKFIKFALTSRELWFSFLFAMCSVMLGVRSILSIASDGWSPKFIVSIIACPVWAMIAAVLFIGFAESWKFGSKH